MAEIENEQRNARPTMLTSVAQYTVVVQRAAAPAKTKYCPPLAVVFTFNETVVPREGFHRLGGLRF